MVRIVSALRTFLVLGFGLLAGGIIGGYATSLVYGQREAPRPPPPQVTPTGAPSCPPCPVCPPSRPDLAAQDAPEVDAPEEVPPLEELELPQEAARPGLPASAVRLASTGFQREIAPCIQQARDTALAGTLLLDLTVTATGGIGHIRDVGVVRREGSVEALETCLVEAAGRVQFDWGSGDGESKLRYPVQVGAH